MKSFKGWSDSMLSALLMVGLILIAEWDGIGAVIAGSWLWLYTSWKEYQADLERAAEYDKRMAEYDKVMNGVV